MILVNLLPEEYCENKPTLPFPLKKISIGLFVVLGMIWVIVGIDYYRLAKNLAGVETELRALSSDLAQSEEIMREMTQDLIPKKTFLEAFEKPEVQWDRIMNLISEVLPEGIWLSSLTMTNFPELIFRMEGFAQPYKNRSAISLVGDFVTQTKKRLGELAFQTHNLSTGYGPQVPVSGQDGLQSRPQFFADMFTQQKDRESEKFTQFVVEFRRK